MYVCMYITIALHADIHSWVRCRGVSPAKHSNPNTYTDGRGRKNCDTWPISATDRTIHHTAKTHTPYHYQ